MPNVTELLHLSRWSETKTATTSGRDEARLRLATARGRGKSDHPAKARLRFGLTRRVGFRRESVIGQGLTGGLRTSVQERALAVRLSHPILVVRSTPDSESRVQLAELLLGLRDSQTDGGATQHPSSRQHYPHRIEPRTKFSDALLVRRDGVAAGSTGRGYHVPGLLHQEEDAYHRPDEQQSYVCPSQLSHVFSLLFIRRGGESGGSPAGVRAGLSRATQAVRASLRQMKAATSASTKLNGMAMGRMPSGRTMRFQITIHIIT